MRTFSWWLVGALASAGPVFVAQPQQAMQPAQAGTEAPAGQLREGFFRPARDPALIRVPEVPNPSRAASAGPVTSSDAAADAAATTAMLQSREAVERELDRAQREDERARAAAPKTTPAIVSPLDGTAPIQSPLDGTAPIISPLGR